MIHNNFSMRVDRRMLLTFRILNVNIIIWGLHIDVIRFFQLRLFQITMSTKKTPVKLEIQNKGKRVITIGAGLFCQRYQTFFEPNNWNLTKKSEEFLKSAGKSLTILRDSQVRRISLCADTELVAYRQLERRWWLKSEILEAISQHSEAYNCFLMMGGNHLCCHPTRKVNRSQIEGFIEELKLCQSYLTYSGANVYVGTIIKRKSNEEKNELSKEMLKKTFDENFVQLNTSFISSQFVHGVHMHKAADKNNLDLIFSYFNIH